MTRPLLNFDDAPSDPIPRLVWLAGVREQVGKELDEQYRSAYFRARQQKQFEAALGLKVHSKKVALAFTRAENRRLGTRVRWQDGLDSTSTSYYNV